MPESNTHIRIIVMGPVGSGKTTQAQLIADHFFIPHFDMGELMRDLDPNSVIGQEVKQYVKSGTLVPDDITLRILKHEISKPEYQKGFILNGTPRTLYQAQNLPFEPDWVVYLVVSDQENIKRLLLRKRQDDTPELIKKRLQVYHEQTEPILDYYRQKGKLFEIDGERPIEAIFQDTVQKL